MKNSALQSELEGWRAIARRYEEIAGILRAALDEIASWNEGEVVGPGFDEPRSSERAREALVEAWYVRRPRGK